MCCRREVLIGFLWLLAVTNVFTAKAISSERVVHHCAGFYQTDPDDPHAITVTGPDFDDSQDTTLIRSMSNYKTPDQLCKDWARETKSEHPDWRVWTKSWNTYSGSPYNPNPSGQNILPVNPAPPGISTGGGHGADQMEDYRQRNEQILQTAKQRTEAANESFLLSSKRLEMDNQKAQLDTERAQLAAKLSRLQDDESALARKKRQSSSAGPYMIIYRPYPDGTEKLGPFETLQEAQQRIPKAQRATWQGTGPPIVVDRAGKNVAEAGYVAPVDTQSQQGLEREEQELKSHRLQSESELSSYLIERKKYEADALAYETANTRLKTKIADLVQASAPVVQATLKPARPQITGTWAGGGSTWVFRADGTFSGPARGRWKSTANGIAVTYSGASVSIPYTFQGAALVGSKYVGGVELHRVGD